NTGATKMNAPVRSRPVCVALPKTRACGPAAAHAAPAKPPTSACDELDGMPRHHVIRFQTIAPKSPAVTTASVIASGCTVPLPIVVATLVSNTRNAMKLKTAAHATAQRGDSTRVDTTVAIELAASWKPLTKSKTSARPTIATTTQSSGILDQD